MPRIIFWMQIKTDIIRHMQIHMHSGKGNPKHEFNMLRGDQAGKCQIIELIQKETGWLLLRHVTQFFVSQ